MTVFIINRVAKVEDQISKFSLVVLSYFHVELQLLLYHIVILCVISQGLKTRLWM